MPHREFVDDSGKHWQVWDVIPSSAERREGTDRRDGSRADDRRSHHEVRVHLEEGFEHGWLAFECTGEKRRLRPIPEQWHQLEDVELIALLGRAERATRERSRPADQER